MSYFVNLGGVNLHLVESVKTDADRDITDYDGLGSGKFDVPENAGLKEFSISCELRQNVNPKYKSWSASELFKQFDVWRARKDPIRLVITSSQYPAENISILVIFKSYSKNEKFPGINETEIHLKEHKNVGVKTTGVPYVTRPGKIPIPAKIAISSNSSKGGGKGVYQLLGKLAPGYGNQNVQLPKVFSEFKTGKPVTNPTTIKNGTTLKVDKITMPYKPIELPNESWVYKSTYTGSNFYDGIARSASSTFASIGSAISKYIDGSTLIRR